MKTHVKLDKTIKILIKPKLLIWNKIKHLHPVLFTIISTQVKRLQLKVKSLYVFHQS